LAMAQDAEKSRAAGMNEHVTKPIVPERLMTVLMTWVSVPEGRAAAGEPSRPSCPCEAIAAC